ncbi:hypothetical protein [Desulfobacter latus]|uniref:Uncharacterized protein n=1 Tax=Desulfobacter latus TaxID=2292 RepID=A0A850T8W2_9BACT|nr:hypothetical protein [Desulfobacter latus]NWH05645.1 hypothetical protein [Desulfobacter latus]
MRNSKQRLKRVIYVLVCIFTAVFFSGTMCMGKEILDYSGDRLSLSAENEPLLPMLERIARTANVVIFISKGFNPGRVSVHLENQPLEKALKQILKGFNVAMVYHKADGEMRLSALKIYPEGKASGPMDVIVRETRPVADPVVTGLNRKPYDSERSDEPSVNAYVHTVRYDALIPTALEFQQKEVAAWKEIITLQNRINAEVDATKNNVLTLALLDKYEAFDDLQSLHINTLEKLDRIESFNANKARQKNE